MVSRSEKAAALLARASIAVFILSILLIGFIATKQAITNTFNDYYFVGLRSVGDGMTLIAVEPNDNCCSSGRLFVGYGVVSGVFYVVVNDSIVDVLNNISDITINNEHICIIKPMVVATDVRGLGNYDIILYVKTCSNQK